MKFLVFKFLTALFYLIITSVSYSIELPDINNIVINKDNKSYKNVIFKDVNNQDINLDDFRNKLLIVNFWATWCAPCRREIPLLNKTQYTYENDLQIIGIAVDFVDDVKAYEKEMPFDYPILVGQENAIAIAEAAGIEFIGLPFTMIISAKDELIKTHLGEIKDHHITKIIDILRRIETQELTIDSARNILGNF